MRTSKSHEQWYELVAQKFDEHQSAHIDLQSAFCEKLQILKVLESEKPSFFAMTHNPEREKLYLDLVELFGDVDVFRGFATIPVYHPSRRLKLDDEALRAAFMAGFQTPQRIFWLTCNKTIASAYEDGRCHEVGEEHSLGYPKCCSDWHYDCFFARAIEAFFETYKKSASNMQLLDYVTSEWQPNSGWFLPSEIYLTGLLLSEHKFPFLGYLACPTCRKSVGSPSARLNESYRDLGNLVDPDTTERVRSWANGLRADLTQRIQSVPKIIKEGSADLELTGLEKGVYERHSRYLVKALELHL
ncbi:MAG: hypothetical protein COA78_00390 [Blastopirellula sp.]|nr:MAG: hypothetical protein COA78_00390 [Blastopirellula sp.]